MSIRPSQAMPVVQRKTGPEARRPQHAENTLEVQIQLKADY